MLKAKAPGFGKNSLGNKMPCGKKKFKQKIRNTRNSRKRKKRKR